VAAIGLQIVIGGEHQLAAIGRRQFEFARHAHGAAAGFGAFAAEDAASIIDGDAPRTIAVAHVDGSGGARLGRRSRVPPGREVELGTSAKLIGDARRDARIIGRRHTHRKRFLQNMEHGS